MPEHPQAARDLVDLPGVGKRTNESLYKFSKCEVRIGLLTAEGIAHILMKNGSRCDADITLAAVSDPFGLYSSFVDGDAVKYGPIPLGGRVDGTCCKRNKQLLIPSVFGTPSCNQIGGAHVRTRYLVTEGQCVRIRRQAAPVLGRQCGPPAQTLILDQARRRYAYAAYPTTYKDAHSIQKVELVSHRVCSGYIQEIY